MDKIKKITTKIICSINNVEKKILPLLQNKIFHVTSYKSYKAIIKTGYIKHNQNNQFSYTYGQSINSFGRKRAYVCLFDLRNVTDESKKYFQDCDFLNFNNVKNKSNVYFIISNRIYPQIISNAKAIQESYSSGEFNAIVPFLECFYPEKINVNDIEQIIIVKYLIPKATIRENEIWNMIESQMLNQK